MRLTSALILIALAACTDADPAVRASVPVETRTVADDPAVRQRLLPTALVAYFPDALGDLVPRLDPDFLYEDEYDAGWSKASVDYASSSGPSRTILVEASDYLDAPDRLARERAKVDTGTGIDTYNVGDVSDRREIPGGAGRSFVHDGYVELHILLADRFYVLLLARSEGMTEDELWLLYDASGVGRLAGAPVRGGPGVPATPAWAAAGVAEWERDASAPPVEAPASPTAEARPLPPCDDVLPLAEVERVCGVTGLRVSLTPFAEEGATTCNRKYAVPRNLSGFVFIVSRFRDTRTARAGQRVASESDDATQRRDVAGLGDAATRYVLDFEEQRTTTGVLAFTVGTDMVEMKTTTMPDERGAEVCTLDQLETLAGRVAGRLAP